jgi:hypothetical protein
MLTLKLQVFLMRLFGRIKTAFADALAISHDLHPPFSLVRANTQQPNFVSHGGFSHVLQIAKPTNFSKVVKLIVLSVAVNVVNVVNRPLTSHVQPRQTMRQSFLVVNSYSPITCIQSAAGAFADKIWAACVVFPHKLSSVGVVLKNRSKMVSGSHEFDLTIEAAK